MHWSHQGPLQLQRPFFPEGETPCHLYWLHPPGGVVGGDGLEITLRAGACSHALVTTPAAGKIYRSTGPTARQDQSLQIEEGAIVEWLPQETILYSGARWATETRVELAAEAAFIGWEIGCLGRPAAAERFEQGQWRQGFEIWRGDHPLFVERALWEGGRDVMARSWGLGGNGVYGVLVATGDVGSLIESLRGLDSALTGRFSVTQLDGVVVCRYLGPATQEVRQSFERAWGLLRPAVIGREACPPRAWRT